ncbi:uncharacterized protein VTP21DRAFT_1941 [Calcarisporiella thermophila]|uniref:uncharacterized protein n=1 Tax=Calcarisporiella thermophila TaxID=911321 RepID=UPI0037443976
MSEYFPLYTPDILNTSKDLQLVHVKGALVVIPTGYKLVPDSDATSPLIAYDRDPVGSSSGTSTPRQVVASITPLLCSAPSISQSGAPSLTTPTSRLTNIRNGKKIPRPRNSFIIYRQERQREINNVYAGISNNDISKIVGELWSLESDEVKEAYRALAEEEKRLHKERYPEYKYKPRKRRKKPDAEVLSPITSYSSTVSTVSPLPPPPVLVPTARIPLLQHQQQSYFSNHEMCPTKREKYHTDLNALSQQVAGAPLEIGSSDTLSGEVEHRAALETDSIIHTTTTLETDLEESIYLTS